MLTGTGLRWIACSCIESFSSSNQVGGYDLIALSRQVKPAWMAVNQTSACFASGWFDHLLNRTLTFLQHTGLSMLETDGPYGGWTFFSHGILDHSLTATLARAPTISIIETSATLSISKTVSRENILGSSANLASTSTNLTTTSTKGEAKLGWATTRSNTLCHVGRTSPFQGRQSTTTLFKRCWQLLLTSKVPSAGWMFLPLTGYYVSDPDVVFEPMTDHLAEYSWGLAQYLGAGVAACYRGHRVFDSPATRCKSVCSLKFECFFPGRWSEPGWASTRNTARCWELTWSMWGGQICRWVSKEIKRSQNLDFFVGLDINQKNILIQSEICISDKLFTCSLFVSK